MHCTYLPARRAASVDPQEMLHKPEVRDGVVGRRRARISSSGLLLVSGRVMNQLMTAQ
jgi:hypothetical protein